MLGRLLSKLFGRKSAAPSGAGSRPVSPPRPTVPLAAPPPPPPPRGYGSAAAPARPVSEATVQVTNTVGSKRQVASALTAAEPVAESTGTVDPLDVSKPLEPEPHDVPAVQSEEPPVALQKGGGPRGVQLILEDGTLAKPSLDPELEERLRYIVDNIVPPSEQPPT